MLSFLRRLEVDIQDLEKLIKGRRSIRQWKRQEVPDELLKKAVELATWAPMEGIIKDGVSSL